MEMRETLSIAFQSKIRSIIVLLTFSLIIGIAPQQDVFAQFKKYESRSKFQKKPADKENSQNQGRENNAPSNHKVPAKSKKVKALSDDLNSAGDGSSNYFGRSGMSRPPLNGSAKSKEFVNLNPETAFGPEVITSFDFPDTDIMELTKYMQKLTGINLILDKEIKGKATIVATGPITVGDAWKAYLTVLNNNGYTLVKSGAFYSVVQTRDIRYIPTKIYTGSFTPNTDNYVMKIVPLKNVSASEINRSFRPFMSRYGRINEIQQTNTIIIQDTGANINRLAKLIKFIDVPGHEESLQIIKVQHSSAQEIAGLLDKILKTNTTRRPGPASSTNNKQSYRLIAEPRTNSIIAMTNAEGANQLRALISKLDQPLESRGAGQIHVYYLQHGDAETMSKTLSTLVSSSTQKTPTSSRLVRNRVEENRPLFSSEVKVTADKANNALVVMASPTDYLTVKNIISQLDIARDQVYVEGLIMDTKVSSGSTLGINLVGAYGEGAMQRWGAAPDGAAGMAGLMAGKFESLGGLFLGLGAGRSREIDLGGGNKVKVNSVNGLISAIASDTNTNILATPQILALDNEDAVFKVGDRVPTPVREANATGSVNSIKYEDVLLELKITPQINKQSRIIKLKIDYKIDDFSGKSVGSQDGIATTTRQAVTTVLVRDRDTIAMGGLMRDKKVNTVKKVPLLGDIPVLGWLFKSKSDETEKINMLFFLTPRILAPYATEAAEATKDVLGRRQRHLEKVYEKDPFGSTVKGIYKKAEEQQKAPLYKDDGISHEATIRGNASASASNSKDSRSNENLEIPDYSEIIRRASQERSKTALNQEEQSKEKVSPNGNGALN